MTLQVLVSTTTSGLRGCTPRRSAGDRLRGRARLAESGRCDAPVVRRAAPIDLAVLDLYLPDGGGLELMRRLDCDVFVVSAAAESVTVRPRCPAARWPI